MEATKMQQDFAARQDVSKQTQETRDVLKARMAEARRRTDELFGIVRPEAIYDRPIPERHRVIFYLGHVEAFDWNLLAGELGLKSFQLAFDRLFAFGIDPVDGGLPSDQPADWPKRGDIEEYNRRVRAALDRAIENALSGDGAEGTQPSGKRAKLTEMLHVAIEHRLMHAETLAYMLHRLPIERKIPGTIISAAGDKPGNNSGDDSGRAGKTTGGMAAIPAGRATLGLRRGASFGWDNEFEEHVVDVKGFSIGTHNVTNAEFLRFIEARGYENRALWSAEAWAWKEKEKIQHPAFWRRAGLKREGRRRESDTWVYRGMFGEVPLPAEWPVYVSHAEATAYAKWLGRVLPSEEQFHRAAYGSPDGTSERAYPWGEELPGARHGNFDSQRWEPAPVGSYPAGASAFGVHDLLGNGWEWTRTPFAPLAGFEAKAFYPGYSADFFDGKHFVMKGGSPRTAASMLRRSFRNWFQPRYPYVYATFRCVEE
jgi:gamma-glutamyl hercynylcysteine S-oxide synthase